MSEKKQLFFGGVPTDVDIRKIREAFPENEMKVGDLFSYGRVEEILGVEYGKARFRTVTNRWRAIVEKETGIIIGTLDGEAFKVLSESEKVELSGSKLRTAARSARRSYVVASRVDIKVLTEDEKKRLDHQTDVSAKIIASAQIKKPAHLPRLAEA